MNVHAKNKPLAKEVDLKTLAKRTPGFTGADLSNLLNEAALLAARHDKAEIEMPDLEEAIDKVINPLSNNNVPVEISFARINPEEEFKRFVGVIRDVTEQKKSDKLRDDFIATLTHDLRTPEC